MPIFYSIILIRVSVRTMKVSEDIEIYFTVSSYGKRVSKQAPYDAGKKDAPKDNGFVTQKIMWWRAKS